MAIDAQLQSDVNRLIKTLQGLEPYIKKVGQADLAHASGILVSAIKGRTPVGDKPHSRYASGKKGSRAAKGSGKVVATYKPGNLRRSFRTLKFRRSSAVFVGPKLGGGQADGYYAHFVEFGTVNQAAKNFVQAAVSAAGNATLRLVTELLGRRVATYGAKYLGNSSSSASGYARAKGRE